MFAVLIITNFAIVFTTTAITQLFLGRIPAGRAMRSNLFVRALQKGFPLLSLSQSLIVVANTPLKIIASCVSKIHFSRIISRIKSDIFVSFIPIFRIF
jgi:hypothetical protein